MLKSSVWYMDVSCGVAIREREGGGEREGVIMQCGICWPRKLYNVVDIKM